MELPLLLPLLISICSKYDDFVIPELFYRVSTLEIALKLWIPACAGMTLYSHLFIMNSY